MSLPSTDWKEIPTLLSRLSFFAVAVNTLLEEDLPDFREEEDLLEEDFRELLEEDFRELLLEDFREPLLEALEPLETEVPSGIHSPNDPCVAPPSERRVLPQLKSSIFQNA